MKIKAPRKVKPFITTEYIVGCPNRYYFIIYVNKRISPLKSKYYTSKKSATNALNKVLKYYNLIDETVLDFSTTK